MPFSIGRSVLTKYTSIHNPTAIADFMILAPMGGNTSFNVFTPKYKELHKSEAPLL
jgi:hypothetical protein